MADYLLLNTKPAFIWDCFLSKLFLKYSADQNRHFYIFINLTAVFSGSATDCRFFVCNKATMCVYGYFRDSCSHSNVPGHVLCSHFSATISSLFYSIFLSFIRTQFVQRGVKHCSSDALLNYKGRYSIATVLFPVLIAC